MIRPWTILLCLALSGCAGLGPERLAEGPAASPAEPDRARLQEAAAAADAARLLARALPPRTRPALEISPAGGPLSAALAAAGVPM